MLRPSQNTYKLMRGAHARIARNWIRDSHRLPFEATRK